MKITFETHDEVYGLLTLVVEEADYSDEVEKTLKDYRKKSTVPGFRPGMAPMGMIRRQYGTTVKVDVINKIIGKQMYDYIDANNIKMLGQPLASDTQTPVEIEGPAPYTFAFDIALAPELSIDLTEDDKIEYVSIAVSDKDIDAMVNMYASRAGSYEKVDSYQDNDMVKGDLKELASDGSAKEDGITVEGAVVMPSYIKDEEQKALFDKATPGATIVFNPRKAYPESDVEVASLLRIERDEAAAMTSDFSYEITEITRFTKAPVDQALFDNVFGKDTVTSEEQFREKIGEKIKDSNAINSDYKFRRVLRRYCEDKVGELHFPDTLLKRVMALKNQDKDEDYIEKNYDGALKELKWQLIRGHLADALNVTVNDEDVKQVARDMARAQFVQYGMTDIPEEYINNFADEMLKKQEDLEGFIDSALEKKLSEAVKTKMTVVNRDMSMEEFTQYTTEE